MPAALSSSEPAHFDLYRSGPAPKLTSTEQLFRLRIPPEQKQLLLPLKETILHVPLFRRSKFTVNGVRILDDKALPGSTLRLRIIILGSVTGMEFPTGLYTF